MNGKVRQVYRPPTSTQPAQPGEVVFTSNNEEGNFYHLSYQFSIPWKEIKVDDYCACLKVGNMTYLLWETDTPSE